MKLAIIVAAAENNVIGDGKGMPWRLPDDMKRFKDLTRGHPVVMGRKTWESIPERFQPLPGRENVVVTRNPNYMAYGSLVAPSLECCLSRFGAEPLVFVIGGGEMYRQALPLADMIYLTRVHTIAKGSVVFPEIDDDLWEQTQSIFHASDDRHEFPFTFFDYKRRGCFTFLER